MSDEKLILLEKIHHLRHVEKLSLREIAIRVFGSSTKESTVRRYLSNDVGFQLSSTDATALLTQEEVDKIGAMRGHSPISEVAEFYGVPLTTVRRIWCGEITSGLSQTPLADLDTHSREYYGHLARTVQRQRDLLRVERKHTRENSRVTNMLEELTTALCDVFGEYDLSADVVTHQSTKGSSVGVIQLSDLHFGERIHEYVGNVFDTGGVAARLKKFVNKASVIFKALGVQNILLALTGDLINSDRRLDEITANASNRAKIVFTAVDILQQLILDLNKNFNVTVASVCGNESRIGKDVAWGTAVASDSFDLMIHEILSRLFVNASGVHFIEMADPLECVVDVNGANFLLVHGHNGLSNTARMESEVSKVRSKYAARGVMIDYVISGHIHSAYISDCFSRSSGLPGGNAYSDKALNLTSRSSQNIFVVDADKSIHGIKIDLQEFDKNFAYSYNAETEEYKPLTTANTVVIQSVVI